MVFYGKAGLLQDERFRHIILRDGGQQVPAGAPPFDAVCILLDRVAIVAEAEEFSEGTGIKHPVVDCEVALAVAQAID